VAQKMGVPLPKQTFSTEAEAKDARLRTVLLEIHERASAFFQESLHRPEGARAREYLAGRGLNEETIKQFRVGFAPDSGFVLRDRLKGEFTEEVMRESGLFSWKESNQHSALSTQPTPPNPVIPSESGSRASERSNAVGGPGVRSELNADGLKSQADLSAMYSKFRNRITFPITNESGRVIAFTGRTLSTDEKAGPKYLNSPETTIYSKSRVLFNLNLAKEAIRALNYAILVEGQMDCISVFAAGFHNVIASSGTAFTAAQAGLLGRFSKQVVVNFDPDAAGAKATERTLGLLIEEEFDIKVLTLEPGFDPDTTLDGLDRLTLGEHHTNEDLHGLDFFQPRKSSLPQSSSRSPSSLSTDPPSETNNEPALVLDPYASLSPLQRDIIIQIHHNVPHFPDGIPIATMCRLVDRITVSESEIRDAIDELMDCGHLYLTIGQNLKMVD